MLVVATLAVVSNVAHIHSFKPGDTEVLAAVCKCLADTICNHAQVSLQCITTCVCCQAHAPIWYVSLHCTASILPLLAVQWRCLWLKVNQKTMLCS